MLGHGAASHSLGLRKRALRPAGAFGRAARESGAEAHARDQVRLIRENLRLAALRIEQDI